MYYKLLMTITLLLVLFGCSNFRKSDETISQKNKVSSSDTKISEQVKESHNKIVFKEKDMRSIIDSLVFDTISTVKTKFETIFSNTLLKNSRLEINYINDSLFALNKQKSCESKDYNIINGFDVLNDSIKSNKVNLNSGAIEYLKDNEYTFYKIKLKNGKIDEYKWKSDEEWLYDFVGYYPEIGYYRFRENEFEGGIKDFLINRINGKEIMFIPNFSCSGKYYEKIETDWGYADIRYIEFILGENLDNPIVNLSYQYFPFSSHNDGFDEFEEHPKNAQLNIEDIRWLDNEDLIFRFTHSITQESDTLFMDKLNVKILIKNAP